MLVLAKRRKISNNIIALLVSRVSQINHHQRSSSRWREGNVEVDVWFIFKSLHTLFISCCRLKWNEKKTTIKQLQHVLFDGNLWTILNQSLIVAHWLSHRRAQRARETEPSDQCERETISSRCLARRKRSKKRLKRRFWCTCSLSKCSPPSSHWMREQIGLK